MRSNSIEPRTVYNAYSVQWQLIQELKWANRHTPLFRLVTKADMTSAFASFHSVGKALWRCANFVAHRHFWRLGVKGFRRTRKMSRRSCHPHRRCQCWPRPCHPQRSPNLQPCRRHSRCWTARQGSVHDLFFLNNRKVTAKGRRHHLVARDAVDHFDCGVCTDLVIALDHVEITVVGNDF